MNEFIIDFTESKSIWYFYESIIEGMEFPDWCGKGMDAIWDLLTGYMEVPATIYIKGMDKLPKDLTEDRDLLLKVLDRAVKWFAKFDEELKVVIIK